MLTPERPVEGHSRGAEQRRKAIIDRFPDVTWFDLDDISREIEVLTRLGIVEVVDPDADA